MEQSKIEKRIIARFGTQKAFSQASGIPESTLSRLLSGEGSWRQEHMAKAIEVLKIPAREIPAYFFEPVTPKTEEA